MKKAAITKDLEHLSGYELTTQLIRGQLGTLDLNGNTKLVLLYFATCYNSKTGKVFPKMKTIADSVGISEIGVKRAVAELVEKGIILKAKKGANCNQYVLTNKIVKYQNDTTQKQDDTLEYQDDTSKGIKMILPCHEVKQHEVKTTNNKVEVENIPDIILKNPDIINKQAYWRSLDNEAKQSYIDKQNEINKQKEAEKRRKEEQERYFAELEEIKKKPPFYTLLDKPTAKTYIEKMLKVDKSLVNGVIGQYLINKFGFEV